MFTCPLASVKLSYGKISTNLLKLDFLLFVSVNFLGNWHTHTEFHHSFRTTYTYKNTSYSTTVDTPEEKRIGETFNRFRCIEWDIAYGFPAEPSWMRTPCCFTVLLSPLLPLNSCVSVVVVAKGQCLPSGSFPRA